MHIVFFCQIVKVMKPIVEASSHVLGNKKVDEGEDLFVCSLSPETKLPPQLLWFYAI